MGVIRPRFVEQRWLQRQLLVVVAQREQLEQRVELELQFGQPQPQQQQPAANGEVPQTQDAGRR